MRRGRKTARIGLSFCVYESGYLGASVAGTITALRAGKRNQKRVNVYLDGDYAFPLDMSVVLSAGLHRGQELTDEDIQRLGSSDSEEQALGRAYRLLSFRPRSVVEVRRNLQEARIAPEVVERVIDRLLANGSLDDAAFARTWVENREAFSPRSSRLLGYELKRLGVTEDDVREALPEDDLASALAASRRRVRSLASLGYDEYLRKLVPFLQRRGFGYDTALRAARAAREELADSETAASEPGAWT
jgi:regulatory protein